MKFTMAIEKKNSLNLSQAEGHNARAHPTRSQLPKPAWLTPEGAFNLVKWRSKVVDQAKDLKKRKDAVLGIELVIQVGNQTDWREAPTDEFPAGKPMPGIGRRLNALMAGVQEAVKAEIGEERLVSVALHTDESTPHVHIVFAPILDGKLQAKHWVGGAAKCAQLRERIHAHITKHLPCEYTKGAAGGAPHDPSKAAGQPQRDEHVQELEQQVQTLFSQLKTEQAKRSKLQEAFDKLSIKFKAAMAQLDLLRPRTPQPSPRADASAPGARGPAP